MNRKAMMIGLAGGVLTMAAAAIAQPPANQPTPPVSSNTPAAAPTWSDAEFGKIAAMVTGSWKTTAPVAGPEGSKTDIVIHAAPVRIEGMSDVMYVEVARADAMQTPYRQTLWQFYKGKGGKTHIKTIEFRTHKGEVGSLTGIWAAPEAFPLGFTVDDVVATLDIELEPKGSGYAGKTPHPYPTSAGGAVEMTTEVAITPDAIETVDRGFGPDGKVVWGPTDGQKYTYKKFDPKVNVERLDGGLVVIDFTQPAGDLKIEQADKLTVQYTGYLSNGTRFDTSRDKPQPFTFTQGTLIPGWNVGLLGATKGTVRRLVIPAAMAYGDRGAGRTIPPNSPLYFEIEILAIERPTPPPPEQPQVPPTTPPTGGNTGNTQPKKPE